MYRRSNQERAARAICLRTTDHRVEGGGAAGVCRQNICYHTAAFVIPFNLICNMTMF